MPIKKENQSTIIVPTTGGPQELHLNDYGIDPNKDLFYEDIVEIITDREASPHSKPFTQKLKGTLHKHQIESKFRTGFADRTPPKCMAQR